MIRLWKKIKKKSVISDAGDSWIRSFKGGVRFGNIDTSELMVKNVEPVDQSFKEFNKIVRKCNKDLLFV